MKATWTLIALLTLITALCARVAEAQQVCYANDGLGRLTGVINENKQAAFYDYDSVGNILSIRRESPVGPVTIFSFDPPSGSAGSRVEVFGLGFSTVASQNTATIGGGAAPVVSTLPCTVVLEVPPNVASGPISVTSPLGTGVSSQSFVRQGLTLAPSNPTMLIGTSQQLGASVVGCANPSVVWTVNGILGGSALLGTISSTGLYTAPAVAPVFRTVSIRASSTGCHSLFAETTITIVSELRGFAFATASVSRGPAIAAFAPGTVGHNVSVRYEPPVAAFAPGTIFHSLSVSHGPASPSLVSSAFSHSASVANGPYISNMSATTAAKGSNFVLTIFGQNLGNAAVLAFVLPSGDDVAVTATNLIVSPAGDVLTANVSVLSTAVTGARTVVVQGVTGNSTAAATGLNVLNVTP